jgi:hypothetical protein
LQVKKQEQFIQELFLFRQKSKEESSVPEVILKYLWLRRDGMGAVKVPLLFIKV